MGLNKRRSHEPRCPRGRSIRARSGRGARVLRREARIPRPHGCAERRLSLAHGAAPGPALVAAPPLHDEATAQTLRAMVAKGAMPPLVLRVDDCRAAYERLHAAGVEFTQE